MFFKKKIIVTEEMKQTLQSFDEISWASCCGIPYKKESYYPYIQETSQASVEKILKHTMNYSDTVCLEICSKKVCCVNQKGQTNCGKCDRLPCERFTKDPTVSDEQNEENLKKMLARLKG